MTLRIARCVKIRKSFDSKDLIVIEREGERERGREGERERGREGERERGREGERESLIDNRAQLIIPFMEMSRTIFFLISFF